MECTEHHFSTQVSYALHEAVHTCKACGLIEISSLAAVAAPPRPLALELETPRGRPSR
jgi:hypothetical protein